MYALKAILGTKCSYGLKRINNFLEMPSPQTKMYNTTFDPEITEERVGYIWLFRALFSFYVNVFFYVSMQMRRCLNRTTMTTLAGTAITQPHPATTLRQPARNGRMFDACPNIANSHAICRHRQQILH